MKICKHNKNGKCMLMKQPYMCTVNCWELVQRSFHNMMVEKQGKDLFV